MLLFPSGSMVPDPGAKVIKAGEYADFLEAGELLAKAREKAEAIVRQADADAEKRTREGYDDGLKKGMEAASEQMLEAVAASVDQLAGMESAIVDVVMRSLRTILGQFDRKELTVQVVRHALRLVRDEKRILLRVAPEDVELAEQRLSEITGKYPGLVRVDVSADGTISGGGCVLETGAGVIDATLKRQLEIIETTFRRNIEERRS